MPHSIIPWGKYPRNIKSTSNGMVPITVIKSLIARFTMKTCGIECNLFTLTIVDTNIALLMMDATMIKENDVAANIAKFKLNEWPIGSVTVCETVVFGNPVEFM